MENESEYKDLYKMLPKNRETRQEDRRKLALKDQKLERSKLQDHKRLFLKEFLIAERVKEDSGKKVLFQNKYNFPFSLQFSEWLKEKPDNLNRWFLVPCPKGQRCFIVACNNITEVYNKEGKRIFYFHSKLPGDGVLRNEFSILDCIFCRELKRFFVLDVVCLGNYNLQHCDATFRRFWLKSRLDENMNYNDSDSSYTFILIDWVDFEDEEAIKMNFYKYPHYAENFPLLDGFLFYHKDASYTFGVTPLVGWLFCFMIPEVLGYEINAIYSLEKPADYVNYLFYINEFDKNQDKKIRERRSIIKSEFKEETDVLEETEKIFEKERFVLENYYDIHSSEKQKHFEYTEVDSIHMIE
ncbi:snurportin-1 [Condylostylus longicornis]|uniref:snurportin-1 n=1 Tax=Condylostylus longicornis TaxID=2530218 RepID=UPI00244E1C7E|nr:snurportin-1 [Condylostylus longicornis]